MQYLANYVLQPPMLLLINTIIVTTLLTRPCSSITSNGWSMKERFSGIRFEIHFDNKNQQTDMKTDYLKQRIRGKADALACFGWVQDSPKGTMVGEARCNKINGHRMKTFLLQYISSRPTPSSDDIQMPRVDKVIIKDYDDTKIKLHFSHFKILDSRRITCFRDVPHQCDSDFINLL